MSGIFSNWLLEHQKNQIFCLFYFTVRQVFYPCCTLSNNKISARLLFRVWSRESESWSELANGEMLHGHVHGAGAMLHGRGSELYAFGGRDVVVAATGTGTRHAERIKLARGANARYCTVHEKSFINGCENGKLLPASVASQVNNYTQKLTPQLSERIPFLLFLTWRFACLPQGGRGSPRCHMLVAATTYDW